MAVNLTKLWDVLDDLLEAGNQFVKAQVETAYGVMHQKFKDQVAKTTTEFDDNALITVEVGIRNKLLEIYPLSEYPKNKKRGSA